MKLIRDLIQINDILLDPQNPRFGDDVGYKPQNQIIRKIFETKAAKELLNSMKQNIKWISNIVVREIASLPNDIKLSLKDENCSAHYIVIEGNNRLACLKTGKIEDYNDETKIPVLRAEREENESVESFNSEIRITQGISNVMVVKEWSKKSKAKHLYELCKSKMKTKNLIFSAVVREISLELGMSTTEVRQSILRYTFFNEIKEIGDTLPDKYWGYLEGVDKNKDLRSFFGLVENKLAFEWLIDEEALVETYPESDLKKELLSNIPSVIQSAANDNLNTKEFRDTLSYIINKNDQNLEDVSAELETLTDDNTKEEERTIKWTTKLENMNEDKGESQEDQWRNKLTEIQKTLTTIPLTSDWIFNIESELRKIGKTVNDGLKMLQVKKENE